LVDTINLIYNGYADQLRTKAPQLKEDEYQICYLSKAGLGNSAIGGLLHATENAIELRKTKIRTKLNLGKKENFRNELDKFVSSNPDGQKKEPSDNRDAELENH